MIQYSMISARDTYSIRQQILRPNQALEACEYEGDHGEETFHIGAYDGEILVSIASFYKEVMKGRDEENPYRLRGMATLPAYRGKGIGQQLIEKSEKVLKERGCRLWWCNARTSARPYYEKLGLIQSGEVFVIEPIGPHVIMFKEM
ncbi:GNAT family N-acetyltransferase [Bacillus sp. KH172YL63]|uniref:GNAT family N-acetyltransferase n=1 Tax=Bacillus sp. KH172YL63 TaxID=2709784 RepID=UPI0013E4627B|nr:GNAT family N-acetyltransferase [Bacillus sp. KH172YL63]BCB04323.1 N-acetyltransferase [Bacillus sp. KH172YL63]